MHIESGFLNISFGLALFFLLAYKIRSFVRSYLIPYLIQQKMALKKRYAAIIDRKKLVTATTVRTEGQIKNQQMEFVLLEKKMQVWHTLLARQQEERAREYEIRIQQIRDKRKVQHEVFSVSKIAEKAIDEACSAVRDKLEQAYAGHDGQDLLKHYVKALHIKK